MGERGVEWLSEDECNRLKEESMPKKKKKAKKKSKKKSKKKKEKESTKNDNSFLE